MINSKVFKSLDRKYGKMLKLKTDIDILVQANKDNPILSQYIDLINQLQKLEKDIFPLIAVGKIKPFIYAEYDIADVENAHKTMLENKNTAKIVLKL